MDLGKDLPNYRQIKTTPKNKPKYKHSINTLWFSIPEIPEGLKGEGYPQQPKYFEVCLQCMKPHFKREDTKRKTKIY